MRQQFGDTVVTVLQLDPGYEIQAPGQDGAMIKGGGIGRCRFPAT